MTSEAIPCDLPGKIALNATVVHGPAPLSPDHVRDQRRSLGRETPKVEPQERRDSCRRLALRRAAALVRSPRARVSGPITAIQILSEPAMLAPWLFHSSGASPRPWSVVTTIVVVPR